MFKMKSSGLTHQDDCEALSQNSRRLKKDRKSSREMVGKYIDGEEENKWRDGGSHSIIAGSQIF